MGRDDFRRLIARRAQAAGEDERRELDDQIVSSHEFEYRALVSA